MTRSTLPEEAFKSPCVVATNANITLSGEQTVNSVAVTAGQRVLVKDQTDTSENGIYVVTTGAWTRATDWNENADTSSGALVVDETNNILYKAEYTGSYTVDSTTVTFTTIFTPITIGDGDITTAKLAARAVTFPKMQRMDTGKIIMGKGAGSDVDQEAISNDATIDEDGVLTIANSAVSTVKIDSNVATFAKMQRMDSGKLLIGQGAGSDVAQYAFSGDATMDEDGVLTIANGAVEAAMVDTDAATTVKFKDGEVTEAKLAVAVQAKINTGWVLVNDSTPTATNTIEFALDTSTYDQFMIVGSGIKHNSGAGERLYLAFSDDGGSTYYESTGTDYDRNIFSSGSTASHDHNVLRFSQQITNPDSDVYTTFVCNLYFINVTNSPLQYKLAEYTIDGSTYRHQVEFGILKQTSIMDYMKFGIEDTNIEFQVTGNIKIYGRTLV